MSKATTNQQKFYFSEKLKRQLDQISRYPLTVVEAPSGFGKTTAVREYLHTSHPEAACIWYTCLGEPAAAAWAGICDLFAGISQKAAEDLKNLAGPKKDTLYYIRVTLKNLKFQGEVYLVVDNYQWISFDLHREFLETLSMHENPQLHIIVITQPVDFVQKLPLHNDNIYTLGAQSFFFDREGIASLFRGEGIRLTEEEMADIVSRTEGWIAAIRLQLLHYKETGSFVGASGIERLVKTAIWNRLAAREKNFLLAVSLFDSFTAQQAAYMLDDGFWPGSVEEWLKTSDFIRFLPNKQVFTIHSVLLDYLRGLFSSHLPRDYRQLLRHRAGLACASVGKYYQAVSFLYQAMDFEAILSLPITRGYLEAHKDKFNGEFLSAFIRECPDALLCQYYSSAIIYAFYGLTNGHLEVYQKLSRLLHALLEGKTELSQEEKLLKSELMLLEALESFNDLAKMRESYQAVRQLWGGDTNLIENSLPWISVFPSAAGMFWRESGKLDEMVHTADSMRPLYLAAERRASGMGLAHLIRTDTLLFRGEDEEAEIACRQALHEAQLTRQTNNCIYAHYCLTRIFLLRGDGENFMEAFKSLREYAEAEELPTRRMAGMCLSILSLALGTKDYITPWLYDMESVRKILNFSMMPFVEAIHFRLLLLDGRYKELFALIPLALERLNRPYGNVRYPLPQTYNYILLAAAKHRSGETQEALQAIEAALRIALPDRVYLPFAGDGCVYDLLSSLDRSAFDGDGRFSELLSLCRRQKSGINAIRKELLRTQSPLTPREREIALLAKERLTAKEIAAKLYISDTTVRWTLTNVYSKLGIHSKSELFFVDF